MQIHSEKNKSTVGSTGIQKRERYKFLSNTAIVIATVHKAIWRVCHWKQRLQSADDEKVQCACTWYRQVNPLHCSLCDISFTKYICICYGLYMLYVVYLVSPAQRAQKTTGQLLSQYCPLLPRYPPHCSCTAIMFVCVHLLDWNWDLYGMLLIKCGDCAYFWMQYSDIN